MRWAGRTAIVAGVLLVSGCAANGADYRREAEKVIRTDRRVQQSTGTTFTKASCLAPGSVKVGVAYSCVALAVDGSTWDFSVKIQENNTIFIDDYKRRA